MADPESRTGTTYGTAAVLDYVNRVHCPQDHALTQAFESPGHHGMPAIQVGQSEGRFVELLLRLVGARKVVEVGTLAGYSALHLARAVGPTGHVWTVEYDPRHAAVARENLAAGGMADRVTVVVGPGRDVLPTLNQHGPFDAVFVDADKGSYDHYGRWAAEHLRPGGLLLGDNAWYFGRLTDDTAEAAAMRRFHEEAAREFDTVCVPTPDGLLLGIKRPSGTP